MATSVFYNTVRLENVVTRRWDEECVYDQSGTDLLSQKFTLTFEGIVHDSNLTLAYISEDSVGGSSGEVYSSGAQCMRRIRRLLEQPRGDLLVTVDGQTLLLCLATTPANLNDPDRDVDNGPKPKGISIVKIVKDTYRVSFTIECCKVECTDGRPIGLVLNNRWSISELMGEDKFIEKTISGRIRCSQSVFSPAAFQNFVIPSLEDGFRRERVEFVISANGLEADYSIVDRQVHYAPPWPATDFECVHSEETGTNGLTFFSDVSVSVTGHPAALKTDLFAIAVFIADSRLKLGERLNDASYLIESAAFIDHIGKQNRVEFRIRVKSLPTEDNLGVWLTSLKTETIGSKLEIPQLTTRDKYGNITSEYDPVKNWVPNTNGYIPHGAERTPAFMFLVQCFLQTPCIDSHAIQQIPPSQDGQQYEPPQEEPPESDTVVMGQQVESLPENEPDQYNDEAREILYTYARSETNWTVHGCRAHLPLARIYEYQVPNGDEETSVVVETGPFMCKQIVTWDAERVGQWPEIPKPVDGWSDGTLKGKLIDHWVRGFPAQIAPDGHQKTFRLSAYYEYALNRRPKEEEKLQMGRLPNLVEVKEDEVVIPQNVNSQEVRVFSDTGQEEHGPVEF